MRLLGRLICLLSVLAAPAASAQNSVIGDLDQHSVSLTTGFSGSQLFIYGSVIGARQEVPFDVIVTVTGPSEPVTVRKKKRQFGIWINGRGVEVDEAPSFYAVATSKAFRETVSYTDDLRYRIGLDQVIRLVDAPAWVENREEYRRAVIRIREEQGLYSVLPFAVGMRANDLFAARIKLPANLVEGDYRARIFLVQNKQVVDVFEDKIEVRRAGLGRWIYSAAQDYPAMYGIGAILVALIAGWLASAFFRTFFPN